MTTEESRIHKREYMREYQRRRYHNDSAYRDKQLKRGKEIYYNNLEYYQNYHKDYDKEYKKCDLNKSGRTKDNIRNHSRYILFKQRKHIKLKDYEIHHCFGYEDPSKFIYISKNLHNTIHRFLKVNNLNADLNHYKYIVDIINESTEYTYISV